MVPSQSSARWGTAIGLLEEALRGIDPVKNADAHSCVSQALGMLRVSCANDSVIPSSDGSRERDRYLAALEKIIRESPDHENWCRATAREALR